MISKQSKSNSSGTYGAQKKYDIKCTFDNPFHHGQKIKHQYKFLQGSKKEKKTKQEMLFLNAQRYL